MSDEDLLRGFESCDLDKASWTHEAHVRVAWLYLRAEGFEGALKNMREGIRRFNASKGGSPDAYNETVTRGYCVLIAHRLECAPADESWESFRARYPELFDRASSPLLVHYRKETILSAAARAAFVEPDLAPLPALTDSK